MRAGTGSAARHEAGMWAIDRVRHVLGENWPERWYARFGALPAFLDRPGSDAAAYAQLVETGLRVGTVAEVLRFPRLVRDWSRDLQPTRMRHVDLQLEVAALARSVGLPVEFEKEFDLPGGSRRPADVVINSESEQFIVECFCVYTDRATGSALDYNREFSFRLVVAAAERDVSISGHWNVRLPPEETAQLLAEATLAMDEVRVTQRTASIQWPGVELRIEPGPSSSDQAVRLVGPTTTSSSWRRAREILDGKAQDWADAPLPVWLRVDLLDGTWLLSQWAQRDLPGKTQWMARLLSEALNGGPAAGVVITGGPQINPSAPAEDYPGQAGAVGMRRHLDALRVRETIIVPLTEPGRRHAAVWRTLYDSEPDWMASALRAASLPGLADIEAGWSRPELAPPAETP